MIHGGDIYNNKVILDFSVNVNPLGMPESVKTALFNAVSEAHVYPDIESAELRKEMSAFLGVKEEALIFTNGASEGFMSIVHALKPKKVLMTAPSFYGYEYASNECEKTYYYLKEEDDFRLTADFLDALDEDVDMVFLCNPNNPTSSSVEGSLVKEILDKCESLGIYTVLDESFSFFCERDNSCIGLTREYKKLIIVSSFTKIFTIPGVRLGICINSDKETVSGIKSSLPEWNLSVFAQRAGMACVKEKEFIEKTRKTVKNERTFLDEGLNKLGIQTFGGEANFILIKTVPDLYERLIKREILIRDCSNFKGLDKGFFRLAVRSHKENEELLEILSEVLK